jgi:hypothetical protein
MPGHDAVRMTDSPPHSYEDDPGVGRLTGGEAAKPAEWQEPPEPRFFFIHVMKTAGTTFTWHALANFGRDQVYPHKDLDPERDIAKYNIGYLTGLSPQRRAGIRVFTGHYPFVAVELLAMELVTITILRDPVERTISFLKHCKRYLDQFRSLPLEQIYEDPFFFPALIRDHQAKLFAMTPDDRPLGYFDVLDVDDRRLEIAKANLARVDVLGLQERFPEFLEEMERYGWRFRNVGDCEVSAGSGVSRSFRRRIAEDNAADLEFYDHAQRLWQRRRARQG